jgi:phosphatidylglycerophosphatase A
MRNRYTATGDRLCEWFVTCSYTGYLPFAPGTWASVLTCIILYFVPRFNHPAVIALLVLAALFAVERIRGEERDPGYIVIDELIGMLVATAGHDLDKWNIVKAFILFRAFDILKPYPIRKVERLPGACGIIADDVLAGIYANIALFIWSYALA